MILRPTGGLTNRLRAILSYRAVHGELAVLWERHVEISNAHFLEVFEPLDGVTFVEDVAPDQQNFNVHAEAPAGWETAWLELRLKSEPASKVASMLRELGPGFSAIHLRRTDHAEMAKRLDARAKDPASQFYEPDRTEPYYRPDEDFERWCHKPGRNVYLATDNGATQRKFCKLLSVYGNRVFFLEDLPDFDPGPFDHRCTPLDHAAVDLWICSHAANFHGTYWSSYSGTIEIMRRLRGLK